MTLRTAWLLLGIACGIIGLPGCFPWHTHRSSCDGVCKGDRPAGAVAWVKTESDGRPPETAGTAVDSGPVLEGGPSAGVSAFTYPPTEAMSASQATETPAGPVPDAVKSQPEPTEPAPLAPAPVSPPNPSHEQPKLAPFLLALQEILNDRHQEALRHLQAYDPETQEFYLRILPTLTILARKRVEELTAQEVAALTDQLQNLLATLRPRTELAIDRMCYCEWVKAYGIYQPLPEGHAFIAPADDRPGEVVRLYAEVRNFASIARNGCYETRLASTIEIRDANGRQVKVLEFKDGEKPLRSLTRLNDYYNTYTFLVPPLAPGTYHLILHIADETNPSARRVVQKTLELRVTPVAARPY
jgi:hypothetical protein